MDAKEQRERAELLGRLDHRALEQGRRDAAARGDLDMAQACHDAMTVRARSQTPELEHCGRLFEHIEAPSRANGNRYLTRYTGDPAAWMSAYTSPGASGKIDRDAGVIAKQTVKLRQGERIQIVGGRGGPRTIPIQ